MLHPAGHHSKHWGSFPFREQKPGRASTPAAVRGEQPARGVAAQRKEGAGKARRVRTATFYVAAFFSIYNIILLYSFKKYYIVLNFQNFANDIVALFCHDFARLSWGRAPRARRTRRSVRMATAASGAPSALSTTSRAASNLLTSWDMHIHILVKRGNFANFNIRKMFTERKQKFAINKCLLTS